MALYRILVADADPRATADYCDYLAACGFDAVGCCDGLHCLELLRTNCPDLLVLDSDLPWGQGDGVLALMRDGDAPSVPVILTNRTAALCRRYPIGRDRIQSFLPKPLAAARVEAAVRFLLGVRQSPPAAVAALPPAAAFPASPLARWN